MPKERPILFSGEMVRQILAGQKTQTRRVMRPQPVYPPKYAGAHKWVWDYGEKPCPYGKPGDLLWVRETWRPAASIDANFDAKIAYGRDHIYYRADQDGYGATKWRPSIFMPRWASRITLRITGVRVEQVQDISEEDAIAEGIEHNWVGDEPCPLEYADEWRNYAGDAEDFPCYSAIDSFRSLWDSINGQRQGCSWENNPWVWCIEFEVLK